MVVASPRVPGHSFRPPAVPLLWPALEQGLGMEMGS